MLSMLTALEARAIAYLITPEDYSLFKHLEVRIADSVQYGGTSIMYAGEISQAVMNAFKVLGYNVTIMRLKDTNVMVRISWEKLMCPQRDLSCTYFQNLEEKETNKDE